MAHVCAIYGYSIEYILTLTYTQIRLLFEYGYNYGFNIRGIDTKGKDIDKRDWDDIRKDLWTEEELKAQEEYKKGKR